MALNFFKPQDIEKIDIDNIPLRFKNYFNSLNDDEKASLLSSRPDLAEALNFSFEKSEKDKENKTIKHVSDNHEIEKKNYNFDRISNNIYALLPKNSILKDDLEPFEALVVDNYQNRCPIHFSTLKDITIRYHLKSGGGFKIQVFYCEKCKRFYIFKEDLAHIEKLLVNEGIEHTLFDYELTKEYLKGKTKVYPIKENQIIFCPETLDIKRPICTIHKTALAKYPCMINNKGRFVYFDGFYCSKCKTFHVPKTKAYNILDECAEKGVFKPKFKEFVNREEVTQTDHPKSIVPHYQVEEGKKQEYPYSKIPNCILLSERDTIVISDCCYCDLGGHQTVEKLVQVWVNERKGGRKNYLLKAGYCDDCQKYYVDVDDYRPIYNSGRAEVIVIYAIEEEEYKITSGEVFNMEKKHLATLENAIDREVNSILNSNDYVSPYETSSYDDGGLAYEKAMSKRKYGKRLDVLDSYKSRPYSYRVDLSSDEITETYYIGINDIVMENGMSVISANSDFGHKLINYQTVKVNKNGIDYDISLSRQFDIEKATLFGYVNLRTDEDAVFKQGITDPFLVRVLNMRKRQHNLTDIFVTIQENQNSIVNCDFNKNIVVQGCAGSGKTMVLLHRLSSLKYREKYFDFSEDALILTPNEEFNLHIKGLADNLQIGNIRRISVEQYYIETLMAYDDKLRPMNKIVSERLLPSWYVDLIYSEKFGVKFIDSFNEILKTRDAYVEDLKNIAELIGVSIDDISTENHHKTLFNMSNAVRTIKGVIDQKDNKVKNSKKKYEETLSRKNNLQKNYEEAKGNYPIHILECEERILTKIKQHQLQNDQRLDSLNEQLIALQEKHIKTSKSIFIFGKQEALNEINNQIEEIEELINNVKRSINVENSIFSIKDTYRTADEIIKWMEDVSFFIKDVEDEVRLCRRLNRELDQFLKAISETQLKIREEKVAYDKALQNAYNQSIKDYFDGIKDEINKYTVENTFQMVFDRTLDQFKEQNDFSKKVGKFHRCDLYARLIFCMYYFQKTIGDKRFICVDEGQDLSLNEYKLIKALNNNRVTFNIFGDVNQLIEKDRGISNWGSVIELFNAKKFVLNENYRNTNQITRFCNDTFDMDVLQTGVDGAKVRLIKRNDLEDDLSKAPIGKKKIAILIPRKIAKSNFLNFEQIPYEMMKIIGEKIGNGLISLMYVDEVKGIEFDKVYVFEDNMETNEKYIAYTRALSELIRVTNTV